jgi:hypothetical protein
MVTTAKIFQLPNKKQELIAKLERRAAAGKVMLSNIEARLKTLRKEQ